MRTTELHEALPRLRESLHGLRDFQRQTVDYVFRRMYVDADCTTRFLVADEVGLGKTKIAQGVIARAIDHLHGHIERIDVVYVCSNAAIARQNLNRLNPFPQVDFNFATRLTLLPIELQGLRRNRVNMISFTPGTAIDTSGGGVWLERVLLYWMLMNHVPDLVGRTGTPLRNLLQAGVTDANWKRLVESNEFAPREDEEDDGEGRYYDDKIAKSFCESLAVDEDLVERLTAALDAFKRKVERPALEDNQLRYEVIGDLRAKLARVCVDALEPDLVILDEFQRFEELLDPAEKSEAAEIARALFDYEDKDGNEARVLLLSATPYRMLSLAGEAEDHHAGFLRTFRFLARNDESEVAALEADLERHRIALGGGAQALNPVDTAAAIRARLLRRMCRTERVALTRKQDAMLTDMPIAVPIAPEAVRTGVLLDRVAGELAVGNPIEYWKSAPYALSFMGDYELKRALVDAASSPTDALVEALDTRSTLVLRRDEVRRWGAVDLGHGRIRSLASATIDSGLWRLLWLPPSLPYVSPGGAYAQVPVSTKALVFSAWNVVPDALAALLSYEAERRVFEGATDAYDATDVRRHGLLAFRVVREDGEARARAMMALALLYPSVTLARHVDPLLIACEHGDGDPLPLARMRQIVMDRLCELVAEKVAKYGATDGTVDKRWYWALPAILDLPWLRLTDWLGEGARAIDAERESLFEDEQEAAPERFDNLFESESEDDRDAGFRAHVAELRELVVRAKSAAGSGARILGRPPEDLLDTVADLAIASPAVCALRAISRVVRDELPADDRTMLTAAAQIARGFRTLFSVPDSVALLRGAAAAESDDDERAPYWRRVLEYCADGNLQAALDELVHLKIDDTGTRDRGHSEQIRAIADVIARSLSPRTSWLGVDDVRARPRAGRIDIESYRLRCRFAMRYGDVRSANDETKIRAGVVKDAFNSPFRPFVLATTSIGQEGLDFHHYCHAVYHWNLPANPVDLEQREGRVHRYKGHAVRRNVAARFGLATLRDRWDDQSEDPWDCLFRVAAETRPAGQSELVPYWLYETEDGVSIERRVPMLPLSSEHGDFARLKSDLATYRLVFGQPRQEDLLALLKKRGVERSAEAFSEWRIDLVPPRVSNGSGGGTT